VKHARQQKVFILPAMGNTENKGWKSLRKKFFIIFWRVNRHIAVISF
jgi:hypothetical protein